MGVNGTGTSRKTGEDCLEIRIRLKSQRGQETPVPGGSVCLGRWSGSVSSALLLLLQN